MAAASFAFSPKIRCELIGSLLSIDCGEKCVYQGIVEQIDCVAQSITLDRPLYNGIPSGLSRLHLRSTDIVGLEVVKSANVIAVPDHAKKDRGRFRRSRSPSSDRSSSAESTPRRSSRSSSRSRHKWHDSRKRRKRDVRSRSRSLRRSYASRRSCFARSSSRSRSRSRCSSYSSRSRTPDRHSDSAKKGRGRFRRSRSTSNDWSSSSRSRSSVRSRHKRHDDSRECRKHDVRSRSGSLRRSYASRRRRFARSSSRSRSRCSSYSSQSSSSDKHSFNLLESSVKHKKHTKKHRTDGSHHRHLQTKSDSTLPTQPKSPSAESQQQLVSTTCESSSAARSSFASSSKTQPKKRKVSRGKEAKPRKPCVKPPTAEKLSCPINDLADEVLLRILKLLPPGDRLIASEVSRRWNGLSRIQWHDVTRLELIEIPENGIRPIVALCPNLQTVVANGEWFAVNELQVFSGTNLSSVKLYACEAFIPEPEHDQDFDIFSRMFSNDLANASWEELVLHDLRVVVQNDEYGGHPTSSSLPVSLKRLQLSGIDVTDPQLETVYLNGPRRFLSDIGHLQNLTCLILTSSIPNILMEYVLMEEGCLLRELQKLTSLRELCLGFFENMPVFTVGFLFNLASLEVLFLHNIELEVEEEEEFGRLVTKHPTLRILAITGQFTHELLVPARRLYPSDFGSTPVPKLHIFVGKEASEKILFTKSSEDALKIHPVTEDLPSFLAKEEIAPIFEGVWIAAQIQESEELFF